LTSKEIIERSNANGKPVSESLFLATIDRIDRRHERMEKVLQQVLVAVAVEEKAHDEHAEQITTKRAQGFQLRLTGVAAVAGALASWITAQFR
jgi:hypothetical protein